MKNAVNWFEIPANDIERAVKFYSTVLNTELQQQEMMGTKMAFFTNDTDGVGGSICSGDAGIHSLLARPLSPRKDLDCHDALELPPRAGGTDSHRLGGRLGGELVSLLDVRSALRRQS